jgi:DNA topoisomerase-3
VSLYSTHYQNLDISARLKQLLLLKALAHIFIGQIDPELVLPTMRSAVEEQLNLIARGQANFTAVLQHTVEIFKQKFLYFVKNIEGMDQLFEVSFSPLAASGKAHSR